MGFSLRQLRYFVAVAEAGQVSAAARELYVSQSAVTAAIQGIERQLGTPVFARTPRGVSLTEAGRSLLPRARQILALVREAEVAPAGEAEVAGRVTVGVSYTVLGYFLPPHIAALTARFPQLEFDWRELDRATIEQQVLSGELDFGLLLTSNLAHDDLACETFVHSQRRLWLAPGHPLASQERVSLADVAEHPYALLTVDEAARTTYGYWGDLAPQVFVSTASIEAIRSLVANGSAITILSDMVYRPWSLEGRRIETVQLTDAVPDMRIGLAWAAGRRFTPPMAALHDYFSAIAGAPPAWP